MKCAICDKECDAGDYCRFHEKTCKNIVVKYDEWKRALEISWKEYLSEIAKNPLTGEWAKQAAQHLLKSGDRTDVKNG